jgi:hypothetical protein
MINDIYNKGILLTAVAGESAVAVADMVIPDPSTIQTLGQLLIQLAIGIVTIWKLIKKPKDKNP